MIKTNTTLLFVFLITVLMYGCRDELQVSKYERPDWLAGKLYTQILEQPELSIFARCLELTEYDKIVDVSGSYTVFAPSDDAFNAWFAANPLYNSVEDIPPAELERLVRYHIVQNQWSKRQLRSLDVFGWIDTLDINNNKPRGFKRETLLLEKNRKYGLAQEDKMINITDTLKSGWFRRVATDSRKYAPVFFSEYFDIYELSGNDYEFYFNRPYGSSNDIHFGNSRIVSDEIFAENGFIYVIDRVVEPLKNAYQFLEDENSGNSYDQFRDLINIFPQFSYNQQKTFEQPGADLGIEVDSLFDLTFPQLAFDLTGERTKTVAGSSGLPQNVTIRYHHGLLAPTNAAFEKFIQEYIQIPRGWGTLKGTPRHIKKIIANSHLSINPVYPTDFRKGFYNGEFDIVEIEETNIVQKEYGSNCTFIGLNEVIVPRAFSSITGPVYLQQGFSKIMYAVGNTGLLPSLKRKNKDYMFFVESDMNTSLDSSLIYDVASNRFRVFQISPGGASSYVLSNNDLRALLLNHVASHRPKGVARKEFIPNLAGNIIIVNNETGEISGTDVTTIGFRGNIPAPEYPVLLSEADNGTTYEIQNWFSFSTTTLYTRISAESPKFHDLMKKAGLTNDQQFRYNFISNNQYYTVLVPTDDAIEAAGLNQLPVEELRQILLTHFIQRTMIFTDAYETPGYYETTRPDEKSTPFSTIYTQIFVEPGIDMIRVRAKDGSIYTEVNESEVTNRLAGVNLGTGQEVIPNTYNNAVIHRINKVLKVDELDTQ